MNSVAKYLFRIRPFPQSMHLKTKPNDLPPRTDWFASVQSPLHFNELDLSLPKDCHLLFLDLDETIVARSTNWFYHSTTGTDINNEKIQIRPHLKDFLIQIQTKYTVILFTASGPKRMNRILDYLGQEFYRTLDRSFTLPGKPLGIHKVKPPVFKDLNRFGVNLRTSLLLDDNPNYFLTCRKNALKIKPYFGGNDDELPKYADLLLKLSEFENIQQPVINLKIEHPDIFDGTRWFF
eukprot:NODE_66_length_25735_cov_0.318497.p17 type:complete len:236 gc:universal NODE_66_length_25735_cov_0.318497:14852-14145(-)